MQYLVTGKFIDDPAVYGKEIVSVWENMIHPSHEMLDAMVKEKKITGGCFAGQRKVVFIIESPSNEEVGRVLGSFPFWALLDWEVIPIQSFRSADDRDLQLIGMLKKSINK